MFGSQILEGAIGLVLVYLFVSLVCSGINQFLTKLTGFRAKTLEEELIRMLNDPDLAQKVLDHGLIKDNPRAGFIRKIFSSSKDNANRNEKGAAKTTWISAQNFTHTLLHILNEMNNTEATSKALDNIENPKVREILKEALVREKQGIEEFEKYLNETRATIEHWFDHKMERLTIWYKTQSRKIIFICSILICAAFNIDTFTVWKSLHQDNAMRQAVTALAVEESKTQTQNVTIEQIRANMDKTGLQFHWSHLPLSQDPWGIPGGHKGNLMKNILEWFAKIFGILITILAVSMGATFWYDTLRKMVNITSKPSSNEDKKKENTDASPLPRVPVNPASELAN